MPPAGWLVDHGSDKKLLSRSVKGVGGRFSVLSPVGMLPAAILGIDVKATLAGAAAVRSRCENADPAANPAFALAAIHHLAAESGRAVCL